MRIDRGAGDGSGLDFAEYGTGVARFGQSDAVVDDVSEGDEVGEVCGRELRDGGDVD